jgi:hypothetical protein
VEGAEEAEAEVEVEANQRAVLVLTSLTAEVGCVGAAFAYGEGTLVAFQACRKGHMEDTADSRPWHGKASSPQMVQVALSCDGSGGVFDHVPHGLQSSHHEVLQHQPRRGSLVAGRRDSGDRHCRGQGFRMALWHSLVRRQRTACAGRTFGSGHIR